MLTWLRDFAGWICRSRYHLERWTGDDQEVGSVGEGCFGVLCASPHLDLCHRPNNENRFCNPRPISPPTSRLHCQRAMFAPASRPAPALRARSACRFALSQRCPTDMQRRQEAFPNKHRTHHSLHGESGASIGCSTSHGPGSQRALAHPRDWHGAAVSGNQSRAEDAWPGLSLLLIPQHG